MNDDLGGVEEQGRRCAGRGGQFSENPFVEGGDDPQYLAWNRGFRSGRVPDPACPNCFGTGRIVLRPTGDGLGPYDGAAIEDLCNVREPKGQP